MICYSISRFCRNNRLFSTAQAGLGPLTGLRVLDLSRILAGPYCTQLLGDLGAEIIKVEKIGEGDGTRSWGPPFVEGESTYFMSVNRNKKSIAIDIGNPEGKQIILEMVQKSDVLIENFLPGTLDKLGLGYEVCRNVNPGLVYCSISGFGSTGPYKKRPGFDIIVSAMYGMMHITGEEDGNPVKPGVAVTDVMTGLQAHGAILAALLERSQSGLGQYIDASLMETQLASLVNIASSYLMTGKESPVPRWGSGHPSIVPYQSFTCQDEKDLVVGIGSDSQFKSLCEVLGCAFLSTDTKFSTNASRVKNRHEIVHLLAVQFQSQPRSHWESLFKEFEKKQPKSAFPFGPVRNISESFEDEQAQHREMTPTLPHPTCGEIRMVGHPVKYSRTPPTYRHPPPLLGEHTREILREVLNWNEEKIDEFVEKKVIE